MKWYTYLLCFILIVAGVFCSIELVKMFNVKSAEYGSIVTIETKNDYTVVSRFDYGNLVLETDDYVNFTNISSFEPTEFNGKENDYTILFNDNPLNNVVLNAGKISGDLNLCFYDLNGDVDVTSNLHVLIEYYSNNTKVTLSMENVDNSVGYFTSYTNINGAVVKVVQRG